MEAQLPEAFDSQMIRDYMQCPSKFYLRHCLSVVPKRFAGVTAPHFFWGGVWHKLMELVHDDGDIEEAIEYLVDLEWHPDLNEEDSKLRTKERMMSIFIDYIKEIGARDVKDWRPVKKECGFDIKCNDPDCALGCNGLRYMGRIDLIAQYKKNKSFWIWDYKTTTWLKKVTFDEFKNGFQLKGYYWAAYHLMPGALLNGILVDLVHVTKHAHEFKRQEFSMTLGPIRDWVRNTNNIIQEIRDNYTAYGSNHELWLRNYNHCEDYAGCLYKELHYEPNAKIRGMMLAQDFRVDRWNPILET